MHMRLFFFTGIFLGLFFVPLAWTSAQVLPTLGSVEINLTPEHPQPGQLVQATISSASESVRAASIVWLLNDRVELEGPGEVSFSFRAGKAGSTQTVGVLMRTTSGQVLANTLTLQPAQVTLLWEADTYTPPFYQGRSLYSSGSLIRAEAIAEFIDSSGNTYDPSKLIYTWSKNGTVIGGISGVAASSIVTEGPKFLGNYILAVEVQAPDGTQVALSAARIQTTEPIIKLYERDPLIGVMYHTAVSTDHIFSGSSQFEVHASPFFMATQHANASSLNYTWQVNGTRVFGDGDTPAELTLQLSGQDSLRTRIRVAVAHVQHLLQAGEETFAVGFEGSARESLFGF